jgi:hypothetical protein
MSRINPSSGLLLRIDPSPHICMTIIPPRTVNEDKMKLPNILSITARVAMDTQLKVLRISLEYTARKFHRLD